MGIAFLPSSCTRLRVRRPWPVATLRNITRADLQLRGNRISESLGHGYGLLVQSTMHGFFIGEVDSGAHRFCDPHGLRGVCADLRTGV